MKRIILSLFFSVLITNAVPPHMLYHHSTNDYLSYIWANYNQLQGNTDIAQQYYEEILRTGGSPYSYPGYIKHLFEKKDFRKILALMPQIEEGLKDNLPIQLIFVKTLELSNMPDAADKKILELSSRFKENAEIMYYACISQLRNKKPAAALTMAEQYLNNSAHKSSHFIFYFIKAQSYVSLLKHEEARENIKKCLELNPGFEQGWLLSGLIAELEGKLELALTGYRTFLELVGHDAAVEQQILNLLIKTQATRVTPQQQSLEQAMAHYRNKNYKQSLFIIEQHLDKQPQDKQAHLLKLELLCCVDRQKDAIDHIKRLLIKEPQEDTWYRALHLMYLAGLEQNGIISLLQVLEKQKKQNKLVKLYLADIYLKKKMLPQALSLLKDALIMVTETDVQEKIIYQIAVIHYETNQLSELTEILKKAELANTSFAPLLNLLAYYYAGKGHNLIKAQAFLDKALGQEAHNIHYLHTQSFIWYKQKEFKKAQTLLDSLMQKAPQDYFILKHMSKILHEQGRTADALKLLQRAEQQATIAHEKIKISQLIKQWSVSSTSLTYHDS